MVALMAGIAIMLILSTVAAQSWADIVRRDNEAEMMFRAQDIVRAAIPGRQRQVAHRAP
jgi:type II secretory pathway pseudopilin PulG